MHRFVVKFSVQLQRIYQRRNKTSSESASSRREFLVSLEREFHKKLIYVTLHFLTWPKKIYVKFVKVMTSYVGVKIYATEIIETVSY